MHKSVFIGTLSLLLGFSFAGEADCPFITSGEIHAIAGDSEAHSAAASIAAARSSAFSAEEALEARCRTWDESDAVQIRTDKFYALTIIVR